MAPYVICNSVCSRLLMMTGGSQQGYGTGCEHMEVGYDEGISFVIKSSSPHPVPVPL
ncbi:hypothetical protein J6590_078852 [Homalodisca vitripennis]|nr:hypothetical protein J6590_078852 [Homalodisca vitripennis]